MTDPHVADHEQEAGRPSTSLLSRIIAPVARAGMYLSVTGLLIIVTIVFYQVFGRYVLNSSPTWTENLALVLILYVTLIGAAVGVRDAGHIGMGGGRGGRPGRRRGGGGRGGRGRGGRF